MKPRSMLMVGAALVAGLAAVSAFAQQQAPQVKSEAAARAEAKDAPMKTDPAEEGELKKQREAAKARKDTANARAAARKTKEGKELEEETIPPQ